jgi:hypothetical protein
MGGEEPCDVDLVGQNAGPSLSSRVEQSEPEDRIYLRVGLVFLANSVKLST